MQYISSKIHTCTEQGFTLVETLVAITILLLVIIGPMTIAQKGIQNAYYANEQTTAVFLAQEAIESIRTQRDDDALSAYRSAGSGHDTWSWYANLPSACKGAGGVGCDYDIRNGNYHACDVEDDCRLNMYSGTNMDNLAYGYGSGSDWSPSIYTRTVRLEPSTDPSTDAVKVTVTVTWNAHAFLGASKSIVLQTWVYDHYKRYE